MYKIKLISKLLFLMVFVINGLDCLPIDSSNSSNTDIITRASWGAANRKGSAEKFGSKKPSLIVIHHSETPSCKTEDECKARIRSIQNYHMNERKWDDIGYNFLVGEDGNIYEGRGWDTKGAHAKNYNSKAIGICMIGSFDDKSPNSAAVTAVKKLITYLSTYNKVKDNYTIVGHRQVGQTTCPGNKLYQMISEWDHYNSKVPK